MQECGVQRRRGETATRVDIISPNKRTPKQALQLFVDAVESTGLVVIQKPDSIVVKLGPGMAKGCPDVAATDGPPVSKTSVPDDSELSEADLDGAIRMVDETHFTVARGLFDKILSNPMVIAKGARVVPSTKDGKPNGFKLYAIHPSSVFAKLGFINGDTIVSINSIDLTSADKALEVCTKVRKSRLIEIDLLRRGEPVPSFISIK